jgi:outer membrane protein assembly factor BamB
MSHKVFCVIAILFAQAATNAHAGDWPQILGPDRNGIAKGEKLLAKWPANGPAEVWSRAVGQGFAGVAIQDGTLLLFHRLEDFEIVEAIDAATAEAMWTQRFECDYESGMSSDSGPRCVPLIADGQVYVFGAKGDLRCLDLKTGKPVWSRDTRGDFSAPEGYFGAGSSPVLFQDRLIVNVGGRDKAGVVAFSTKDGSTLWQNVEDNASYSSPIVVNVGGNPHAIVVTRLNTVSLNPADGTIRFQFPFGMRGPTVNGATPVVIDDHLFVSASYRVGSVWAKMKASSVDVTASEEKLLATQYATPIHHNGVLFAADGRQDMGSATLKCIDPAAEKVLWEQGGFDYGTLVKVNDELLFLTTEGELIRFAADVKAYSEKQRCNVLNATPRGYRLPAISNGRLYVRDDKTLKCLQIGE